MSEVEQRFVLIREVVIRAMHRLENRSLSEHENRRVYGPCFSEHGHDYRISVVLSQALNERSGLVFERDRLDRILRSALVDPLDGSDLNALFVNTAGEALARALFLRLVPLFPIGVLVRVGIQETRKNYFEFPPADRHS